MALLDIDDLQVEFGTEAAPFIAVDGLDLQIDAGEVVGIVGESGSGKKCDFAGLDGPDRLSGAGNGAPDGL